MERTSDKFHGLRESAMGLSTEQKVDYENRPRITLNKKTAGLTFQEQWQEHITHIYCHLCYQTKC